MRLVCVVVVEVRLMEWWWWWLVFLDKAYHSQLEECRYWLNNHQIMTKS